MAGGPIEEGAGVGVGWRWWRVGRRRATLTLNRVSWCLHGSLHILSLTSLLTILCFRIYSILRAFTFLVSLIRIGYRLQVLRVNRE